MPHDLTLDERILYRFQFWLIHKKGWFKIMIPILIILIWINIVTDGLDCDLKSIFQISCPRKSKSKNTNYNRDSIGKCNEDKDCEEICNIWTKTKTKNSLYPSNILKYNCSEGICQCNNFIESCSQQGPICPWA